MQVHLSKQQNSITASKNRNFSSSNILIGVVVVTIMLTGMAVIPGYGSFITGSIFILFTLRHLIIATNRKPLLLEITNDKITYLSEESNKLITILPNEILSINHKFCELQIHTKDEVVHNINLLNTGSEQTRWEIKEHIRMLIDKIS